MTKFRVEVSAPGVDPLTFETREAADKYTLALFRRLPHIDRIRIVKVTEEVETVWREPRAVA